jgi:acetyl esterase/lipase
VNNINSSKYQDTLDRQSLLAFDYASESDNTTIGGYTMETDNNTIITGHLPDATTNPAPKITCFPATGNKTDIGLIIFPGGGYGMLAQHEGAGYAKAFAEAGISCFVVEYRLGSTGYRHPAMLEDALAAISTIRQQANDWGLHPEKIGIMGSSAGGHLTAHTLTAWNQYDASLRPSFGILCYPVIISTGEYAHHGSMQNLAGKDASDALLVSLSCEKNVSSQTPPCFLWHTLQDQAVPAENSFEFAKALRKHNVPFEMHIYPYGRHGLGLDTPFTWSVDCVRWIKATCETVQA